MLTKRGHNKSIDWYLFGVLLYELLTGAPPYFSSNREQLFKNIVDGVLRVPKGMNKVAIELISKLLNRNPVARLGSGPDDAEEIKRHPFFAEIDWNKLMNREYEVPLPQVEKIEVNPQEVAEFEDEEMRFKMKRQEKQMQNKPYTIVDMKHAKVAEQLKKFPDLMTVSDKDAIQLERWSFSLKNR